MESLPMVLPTCPSSEEHGQLILRSQDYQTYEQKFCGTWYDCPVCRSSVLFESPELKAQLDEQKDRLAGQELAKAKRKARYGHRDWLYWRDKNGMPHAELKSEESLKEAMTALEESCLVTLLCASDGVGMIVNKDMANIMLGNIKYGI